MANIRKSFNFRSGLQVDNDNFVINANGLVGIGTSVPQNYLLNVYGDTRTTGLTTTRDLYVTQNVEVIGVTTVGVLTASSIDIANGVNVGGALTALTLKLSNGDTVDNLIGFARTTFITDNGGVGLHTTSKIGINTTTSPGASDPELSVIGNANVTGIITATTFDGNVTGDVTGNVNASSGVSTFTELKVGTAITMSAGIITATTFDGNVTGDVTGNVTGNVNASSGVSTFTELKVGTAITMSAGIITATTFDGNVTGDVTGNVNASSGVSTFTELKVGTAITMSAGIITATTFVGSLTGTATTATNLADAANITTGTINNDRLPTTPQFTSVGIGTDSPTDALHIQRSGAAEIYVGSDTDASSLRVGRNLNDDTSGMVKYGNTSGIYPYSTENSLDFMNFGEGNVNFYLESGTLSSDILSFHWHRGGATRLMSLTNEGNLGIGITNPTHKLNVQGISTFTGNAHFDQDVTIGGSLSFSAGSNITATLIGDVQNSSFDVILDVSEPRVNANVTGNLTGDVNGSLAGISTFNYINSNRVGIGTTTPRCALDIKDSNSSGSGFVLLPSQTTGNRDSIFPLIEGALIYNNTLKRLELYNGTSWVGLTTEA